MKKLIELIKIEFKDTCKKFFQPMKSRWFLPATMVASFSLTLYTLNDTSKEVYRTSSNQELTILKRYDEGIKGIYTMEEIKQLFEDYDLVAKQNK